MISRSKLQVLIVPLFACSTISTAYAVKARGFDDRSTDITLYNELGVNLTLHEKGLLYGRWKKGPRVKFPDDASAIMGTESVAWLTGAGAWVSYKVDDDGTILTFRWENPYSGGNRYSATSEDKRYYFTTEGTGSGKNASLRWHLKRRAPIKNYSVVIMADPQPWRRAGNVGNPNDQSNRQPWLEENRKVAKSIRSLGASFHIVNGDLTEFGRKETYEDYRDVYATLGVPTYEGLGNHDYANNVDDCAIPEALNFSTNACAVRATERMYSEIVKYEKALSYFRSDAEMTDSATPVSVKTRLRGSLAYSWDYGDIHYVQLHNYPTYAVSMSATGMSSFITDSLTWLWFDLDAADARGKNTIINFHDARPKNDDGDSHFIGESSSWVLALFRAIISSHRVKAIFVGHTHQRAYCRAQNDPVFGNVPIYTAGALFEGDYYLLNVNGLDIDVKAYNGKDGIPVLKEDLGRVGANVVFDATCSNLEP